MIRVGSKQELADLYEAYKKDPRFDHLRRDTVNFVPGVGPLKPTLMLIGEAPGRMENAKRIPFVGQAGQALTNLLEDVGIIEYDIFETNAVKYWPPRRGTPPNVTPTEEEISASREYLLREIEIVDPAIIGMCGVSAYKAVFADAKTIYDHHGELLEGRFVPLYHPARICYDPSTKPKVREGYTKLRAYMDARSVA